MIGFLFSTFLLAQDPCQGVVAENPIYKQIDATVVSKIVGASQLVTISSEADQVLAKLIGAKSPVLMTWLKKRNLLSATEEVIALEWRRYYLDNFILGQFPTKNSEINKSVEGLFSDINQAVFNAAFKKKLSDLFTKAQKDAQDLVKTWSLDESAEKQILHKMGGIKLFWFEKLQGSRYENKPLEFVKWGLAYDPQFNEINVGVHALKYPSDPSLYSVLLHEIAHSIDSCRWSAFFQGVSPFEGLNECLRSADATGAKPRDDSKMNRAIKKGVLTADTAQALRMNPTCNRTFYPMGASQRDQLPEVFADWFSAETFARSSFKKQFPRPDLCAEHELQDGSSYLTNRQRIEKIYLTQPTLAQQFKFKKAGKYCPLTQQPKKPTALRQ